MSMSNKCPLALGFLFGFAKRVVGGLSFRKSLALYVDTMLLDTELPDFCQEGSEQGKLG